MSKKWVEMGCILHFSLCNLHFSLERSDESSVKKRGKGREFSLFNYKVLGMVVGLALFAPFAKFARKKGK